MPQLNEEQFRANRFDLLSRLADDLAHEIKNPLNAIVINLEVLRARVRKGAGEAALNRADVIESEVRRVHQLVDRMLQLLRPSRDDGSALPLDRALDDVLPLIEAQTRLARNMFVVECNVPVFVTVRSDVLNFALLNIFAALQERLGEAGGTLFLECDAGGEDVRLTMRDAPATVGAVAPAEEGVRTAVRIAGDLLGTCGGSVTYNDGAVTVVLPRSASL